MHYGEIKTCDIANGAGVRSTLFVSGCRNACPGCFNPETWSFSYGEEFTREAADRLIESLRPGFVAGITILGGEPMEPENQEVLAPFLERVRAELPDKSIWLYSGFTWEELTHGENRARTPFTERILATLDVLVDGRFVLALKDITLRFRGSSNQRILDVPASLEAGRAVLWEDDAVFSTHAW